jgi:2-polyprenyl-6-methoxyphenol hydroxylase-like FAD-dependent oxidoreductase
MPAASSILIVGGGLAGMTLGVGLARAGVHAEIVELTPEWSVTGMGISLQGPALRALAAIGVRDQCIRSGFGYSYFKACDANGNVTGTVRLPRLNGPRYPATIGIMRQDLHSVLKQAVAKAGVPIRLGITVTSLKQNDHHVSVQFNDGTKGRYDLIVGADGANSKIRELVFGPQFRPKYTGQAVWRATVRRPQDVRARCSFYGPRSKAGFNPVSHTQMYIYLQQNLPNLVRFPDDQLPALMRAQLDDFGGLLAAAREEITTPEQIVCRPVVSHILPPPWYRGRVILIGDAAHCVTPHMATGAGIAIEDSVVLALLLSSGSTLQNALENFMTRRYDRCHMVVENSRQLGEWEKYPNAHDVDHVDFLDKSLKALAQPI